MRKCRPVDVIDQSRKVKNLGKHHRPIGCDDLVQKVMSLDTNPSPMGYIYALLSLELAGRVCFSFVFGSAEIIERVAKSTIPRRCRRQQQT